MRTTIRARSRPYAPDLRANQRICQRCGIQYSWRTPRDTHLTECPDCRELARGR